MSKFEGVQIKIPKARVIFSNLFELDKYGKYSVTFLLSKKDHLEIINVIKDNVAKMKKVLRVTKLDKEVLICCDEELNDIDDSDDIGKQKKEARANNAGHYRIQASTQVKFPPTLRKFKEVDLDIAKDEDPFGYGSYINVIFDLKPYDNQNGKGISKTLKYVLLSRSADNAIVKVDGDNFFKDSDCLEPVEDVTADDTSDAFEDEKLF